MTLTAVLNPDSQGGYVAYNPETGTTTQGETISEALAKNRKLLEQFVMEFFEFSKSLRFHGRRLRRKVAGRYGVLTPLSGWGRVSIGNWRRIRRGDS
jgi:predicted RNase H-like HicB family nuclease